MEDPEGTDVQSVPRKRHRIAWPSKRFWKKVGRIARRIGIGLAVAVLVGLVVLYFVDRHMARTKDECKRGVLPFVGTYMEAWPFANMWQWVGVSGELRRYAYDERTQTLTVRLRGSGLLHRTRAFRFHVHKLPSGLLEELEAVKGDPDSHVYFRHFSTFFNDARDDSGGKLTVQRWMRPGDKRTLYDLVGGTADVTRSVAGFPWEHEVDDASGVIRLRLRLQYRGVRTCTVAMDFDRLPQGLDEELALVEAAARQDSDDVLGVRCSWRDSPDVTERRITVQIRLPDGVRITAYDLRRGERWVAWQEARGALEQFVADEGAGTLELTVAGESEGRQHAVHMESCTFPEGFLEELRAIKEDKKEPRVSCRVSRTLRDGIVSVTTCVVNVTRDNPAAEGRTIERRYDLVSGEVEEWKQPLLLPPRSLSPGPSSGP